MARLAQIERRMKWDDVSVATIIDNLLENATFTVRQYAFSQSFTSVEINSNGYSVRLMSQQSAAIFIRFI